MGKLNSNQKGFSVVEVILVIVIVGLLAVVGWFVYNRSNDKGPSSVTNTQTSATTPSNTTTKTDLSKYLVIKEWAVKIPLNSDVAGLTYTIGSNNVATFRTNALDDASMENCGGSNSIAVARGKATDIPPNETDSTESNFKDYYEAAIKNDDSPNSTTNTRDIHLYIGSYYYVPPGYTSASCAKEASAEKEGKAALAIVNAVSKMVAE